MKEQNSDWRMPLIDELKTLVVKGAYPTIDDKVFPGCPAAGFWSGSPSAGYSGSAWGVGFSDGYASYYYHRSYPLHVRLVRGGQDFDPLWLALDTEGRWYDCGDGVAFDRTTGLQWQRYCVGQQWTDEGMPSGRPDLLTWDPAMERFGVKDAQGDLDPPKTWYALRNTGEVICLGAHEDFETAEAACKDAVWIFDQETANEWMGVMDPKWLGRIRAAEALEPLLTSFEDLRAGYPERELHEAPLVTVQRAKAALAALQGEPAC